MLEDPLTTEMPHPSALDVVVGLAEMMASCAAERLLRIDELRRARLAEAEASAARFTDVVLRGVRLELAAAMRVTALRMGFMARLPLLDRGTPQATVSSRGQTSMRPNARELTYPKIRCCCPFAGQ